MWEGIWVLLQEPEAVLIVFLVSVYKVLTTPGNQEAGALALVQTLTTDSSVDTADWVHRKSSHQNSGGMPYCQGCQIILEI